jgi:hypothetical protein
METHIRIEYHVVEFLQYVVDFLKPLGISKLSHRLITFVWISGHKTYVRLLIGYEPAFSANIYCGK